MTDSALSLGQARRVALAAQGFGRDHPPAVGTRQLNATIERLALLQLDSVNVFERSHYLPIFARLGAYDRSALDALTFARPGPRSSATPRYLEYWAHEAAIIPVDAWPLFRWRMAELRAKYGAKSDGWVRSNTAMLDWLRAEVAEKGPLAASEIQHDSGKGAGGWWGWSDVKTGLEYLFMFGELVTAGRTRFERSYDLPERRLPAAVLNRSVDKPDAVRELVRASALAHGVGTLADFADYFRLKNDVARTAIGELVDSGELLPVTVQGWAKPAWLHRDARIPRRIDAAALLSPFDPVVWARDRAERLFDFHYRIEIYTPAAKRVYGYYTLPLLIDDRIVGRVDLKNDRKQRVLRVQSAWTEPDAPRETAARLAALLEETAAWQGLERIAVTGRGDLAPALAAELGLGVTTL